MKLKWGPRLDIKLKHFLISPMLNLGYRYFTQDAIDVQQIVSMEGIVTSSGIIHKVNIFNQDELKIKGFALIPKLRMSYFFGRLGIWIEGNYTLGQTNTAKGTMLVPNGLPNTTTGEYTLDQLQRGTLQSWETSEKHSTMGLLIGGSFQIFN